MAKRFLLQIAVLGVLLSGAFVVSHAQRADPAIAIDNDDIGGVVTGPSGPEAGVWVIAETSDTPTRFIKIVVTDAQGRYALPELPKANYKVWVRGYGLVDSTAVQTTPGKALIGVIYPKGQEATLSDNFDGKPYGRPNDLVVDKKGGVYFSEPGPNATPGQPPPTPALTPAVYYLPAGGKSMRIADGIVRPNGIQLSPDEKTLYVNDTSGEYVLAFAIKPDGSVGNRRNFAKYPTVTTTPAGGFNSGADGLAIDNDGRVYVVSLGGVHVFSPKGDLLGTIPLSLPGQNIAFAGADKKTLYIVGRGAAFKVRLLTAGFMGRAK